ncbi:MAG: LON peptidase substrate-binding domain-containing protein [Dermatophilaceae bacterium]|nr:LON peptidase substrate-binding domain-containing protein [Intrasporangiaceae bacterium]
MSRLPLFPLGTVLFPGVRLPLQVFEPRYVELLRDLGRRPPQERRFGVVALRRGNEVATAGAPELSVTGTAARLTSIRSAAGGPAGVVLIIETVGESRFRLDSFAADDTPYFVGEVTWLEDTSADAGELARAGAEACAAYDAFLTAVGGTVRPVDAPLERLAYEIVETVALPVEDRQAVLDAGDPVRRLTLVTRLLRRETLLFGGLHLVPTERYDFAPPSQN